MKKIILLSMLIILFSCNSSGKSERVFKAIRVIDGDSFVAQVDSDYEKSFLATVKINGIKAPLISESFYTPAQSHLSRLIANKEVKLYNIKDLGNDSIRADVYLGQKNIAADMLKEGLVQFKSSDAISDSLREKYLSMWIIAKNLRKGMYH